MSTQFITNEEKLLSDVINNILPSSEKLYFLIGYFYFSGFQEIYKKIGDKEINILVGLEIEHDLTNKIREFEIIGEAVGKIPDELKQKHPDVEWQDIKDFRNLLVHEYFGVDMEIVWKVIQENLPVLVNAVKEILQTESE